MADEEWQHGLNFSTADMLGNACIKGGAGAREAKGDAGEATSLVPANPHTRPVHPLPPHTPPRAPYASLLAPDSIASTFSLASTQLPSPHFPLPDVVMRLSDKGAKHASSMDSKATEGEGPLQCKVPYGL